MGRGSVPACVAAPADVAPGHAGSKAAPRMREEDEMSVRTIVLAIVLVAVAVVYAVPAEANSNHFLTAQQLFGETPGAYQYVLMGTMWYTTLVAVTHPWVFWLAYNDVDYLDADGEFWTAKAAYWATVAQWGWGVAVVEQYWSLTGFNDLLYEGVAPYYYYMYGKWMFAAYVALAYAFSDIQQLEDEMSYGVGVGASYNAELGENVTLTPGVTVQYYDSGQTGWQESLAIMAGAKLKWDVSAEGAVGAYVHLITETEDIADDTWWDAGVKGSYKFSDSITGFASVSTTQGAEDYDSTRFLLGVNVSF